MAVSDVRVEQHPGRSLAVVRRRAAQAELSRVVPEACGAVWNIIRSQQVNGAGRHVAVYLDGEINLEVGVELDDGGGFDGFGEVVRSSTPVGPVATVTHFGPYGRLGEAHDAIRRWCADNGHEFAGPSWEVYGHWQDDWNNDPSKITADVFYLLASH